MYSFFGTSKIASLPKLLTILFYSDWLWPYCATSRDQKLLQVETKRFFTNRATYGTLDSPYCTIDYLALPNRPIRAKNDVMLKTILPGTISDGT